MKYAAHINGDKIQTVREHCRNTADLCQKFCMSFGTENIGRVQGLFHDAGKMTGNFNNYIRGLSAVKRGEIDHSYAGARYLTEIADDKNAGVLSLIARTIISHHGLHDWVDSNCCDYFQKRISSDYDYENIRENIYTVVSEKELSELLDKALSEYKSIRAKIKSIYKGKTDYAFYIGMTERMLQSALMDADRIDTADFMSGELHQEISADERKMLWKRMHDAMEKKLELFSERKDKISLQRRSISDRCAAFAKNDVKVCRMIVPTGGGKTLSSLRFAVDYCVTHDMERIIYTAPFMSILEQNSDEICSIAGSEYFTEHHSDAAAQLDPEEDSQKYKEYEAHTERWDSPVIATTMVQFLNTLFSSKTASVRRMHRLSRAVIIIDEVQSIPLKCVNLFNLAVNFLTNVCGAAVVLCTATQPANDKTKYPLMLDEKDSMTGDYSVDFEVFKRTEITPCIDSYGYSFDETADFCFEKFRENGNLLAIVNTKKSALKLYELLSGKCDKGTEIIHLSTNMCPEHRREKIKLIRELLSEKKPVICVTTQLIEAGVDISFRCVVRSAAGLDNAAQAAGRCNRHGEAGRICPVYIINVKDEALGSLKEISVSREITQQIVDSGKYADLQSAKTISDYFRELYRLEEKELSYNVCDNDQKTTLVDLLSLNKNRYEISPMTSSPYCSQAFRTAGDLFEVIDSHTVDVIVPYNDEAEELIYRLEQPDENYRILLRKTQKFTVSIYSQTQKKLAENHALRQLECGAVILDRTYYDDIVGVKLEGAEKEILIF